MMYDIRSDAPFYHAYTAAGGFVSPSLLVIAAVTYQPWHLLSTVTVT